MLDLGRRFGAYFIELSKNGFDWEHGRFEDDYVSAFRSAKAESNNNRRMERVWDVTTNKVLVTFRKGLQVSKPASDSNPWWIKS